MLPMQDKDIDSERLLIKAGRGLLRKLILKLIMNLTVHPEENPDGKPRNQLCMMR
jgi:hypothetical protein